MTVLDYAPVPQTLPPRQWSGLLLIPVSLIALAILLGAGTNAVNGVVFPRYFDVVLKNSTPMLWRDIVAHGVLEATVFGFVGGIIVAVAWLAISGARLRVSMVVRRFPQSAIIAASAWIAGGCVGWGWAKFFPRSFAEQFPISSGGLWAEPWGWVGGSIWGIYGGAALVTVYLCVSIHLCWRRQTLA